MFLKTKYEYINSGFRLFKDLKTSYIKVLKLVSVFRELKFHCYPEEIQRSFSRSSRQEVFCKKGALRNSAEFTGKHLCQGLFFNKVAVLFNKVAGLLPETLLKKRLRHRCFPVNFVKFLRAPFLAKGSSGCFFFSYCYIPHLWCFVVNLLNYEI